MQDPSLSHATDAKVRNLLGVPGAITADLIMQLIGIASIAVLLPIAVWGWRLATHRPLRRERLRLLTWVIAIVIGRGLCLLPAADARLAVAERSRRRDR